MCAQTLVINAACDTVVRHLFLAHLDPLLTPTFTSISIKCDDHSAAKSDFPKSFMKT